MDGDSAHRRLELLARLGRPVSHAQSRDQGIAILADGLASLGFGLTVSAVDGDTVRVLILRTPSGTPMSTAEVEAAVTATLPDMVMQVDAVRCIGVPVRLRMPYVGTETAAHLIHAMPTFPPADIPTLGRLGEFPVAAVPVEVGDEVVAVLAVFGPAADADAVPLLVALATHLSMVWGRRDERLTVPPPHHPAVTGMPHHAMASDIDALLLPGAVRAALQPVVRLHDAAVVGHEALTRFVPREAVRTPEDLFRAAALLDRQSEVDAACLRVALDEAARAGVATSLFLNVTMRWLLTHEDSPDDLIDMVSAVGFEPGAVVLEFSEREPVDDVARLQRVTARLRAHGFRIAVDDAGAGHASMLVVAEVRPDFLKVDRALIHSLDTDRARRSLVAALLSFAAHIGARLIAEGVESERERRTLLDLGVLHAQGWHLSRPLMVDPPEGVADVLAVEPRWFSQQRVQPFDRLQSAATVAAPAPQQQRPPVRRLQPRERLSLPQALSGAALALQNEHDRDRILGVIAEQLQRVVLVEEMVIYAADYEAHKFVPLLATGPDAEQIMAHSFSMDVGITGWTFARSTPENVGNTNAHPAAGWVPGTAVVDESLLCIPLVAADRRLGILNCYRPGLDRFTAAELEAATLFAHMAAAAWRNAQLYTELVEAAVTDPLTGLLNTRWLRDAGQREVAQCQRSGESMAVLLIDLDHFKSVNDTGGHAAGDIVLRRVARELRGLVRRGDAAVRFGGEEFLLLLRNTDEAGALRVAGAVAPALRGIRVPDDCPLDGLTASIGVAVFPTHGDDLDALVRAADVAMYSAKHAGRDRAVVAWGASIPG